MGFGAYQPDDVYKDGDLVYGLSHFRGALGLYWRTTLGWKVPINIANTFIDSYLDLWDSPATGGKSAPFHTALTKHPKYNVWTKSAHKGDKVEYGKPSEKADMWRRKSKGGIYWGTIVKKCTVHFCLGGLDDPKSMMMVCTKKYEYAGVHHDAGAGDTKARNITASELRWVYRNRGVDLVQRNVQFWRPQKTDWVQCGPPWEWTADAVDVKTADAWGLYKPKKEPGDQDYQGL